MKKVIVCLLVVAFAKINSFGQYSFGVSTGITFNSAYFGYKINKKLLTYVGFQFANIGSTIETSGMRFSNNSSGLENYTDKSITNINLYLPNIGARYYINEKNKIRSYTTLNISKPIVGGNQKNNGTTSSSFKDDLKNITLFGGELGYGVEYCFDENFSLGGEFGLRYLHYNSKSETPNNYYDYNTGHSTSYTETSSNSLHVSPTYAKFVLNYCF